MKKNTICATPARHFAVISPGIAQFEKKITRTETRNK